MPTPERFARTERNMEDKLRWNNTIKVLALSLAATTALSAPSFAQTALRVFAPQDAAQDLNTNAFTKEIEDKFGIDLSFETTTYDGGAAMEKRQITLASGDYPEAFLLIGWLDVLSQAELLKYADYGVVLPLNDLIDQHAPNIKAAFEKVPAFKALATAPDGNIYGLPQWNDCYHCSYAAKLWLNTDWLDKLGLEMPKTTEEMKAVLTAFKTQDPNGNGRADEIPLSADKSDYIVPYFMNAFIYDPRSSDAAPMMLALNGDKLQFQAMQDGWRQGLAYISDLYKDGLVDSGAFTQNRDALSALGNSAEGTIVGAATLMHPAIMVENGQPDGRDKNYDPVPPLTGPGGVSYTSYNLPSRPGASFVITNKANEEQQIAAIKMLDYLFTDEGRLNGYYGFEGENWAKPDAGDVALDASNPPIFKALPDPNNGQPTNRAWGALVQFFQDNEWRGGQVQPEDIYEPSGYERRLFQATKLYEPHVPTDQVFPYWNVWVDASQADELAQLQTNINNYVQQANAEFITGQRDINDDAAWEGYVNDLKNLGVDRYVEIYQASYDASAK